MTIETDKLKDNFKARSIPQESDFHDLIEMADVGRLAAGQSPEQQKDNDKAITGLQVGTDKRLAIKPKTTSGLDITADGVGVLANTAAGISVGALGVGVNHDDTLLVNTDKLGVADKFVKKEGDSTIIGGNLVFHDDDKGIVFMNGSKIIKRKEHGPTWFMEANPHPADPYTPRLPQICESDGTNASNIATEKYVTDSLKQATDGLIKPVTGGGLAVADDRVSLSVKKGNGIDASADAVTVKAKSGGGLKVTADGVELAINSPAGQTMSSDSLIQYIDSIYVKSLAALCGGNPKGYVDFPGVCTVIFTFKKPHTYCAYTFPAPGTSIPVKDFTTVDGFSHASPVIIAGLRFPGNPDVYHITDKEITVSIFDCTDVPNWGPGEDTKFMLYYINTADVALSVLRVNGFFVSF